MVFRSTPAAQQTLVRDNRILSAGNAAFAAIAFDGGYDQDRTSDFSGTRVMDNTLWTGDRTHFDIGISVGARPWFGDRHDPGTGASVTGNTTASMSAVVSTGIAVSGMYDATVKGNDLDVRPRSLGACPVTHFGVDADGYARGGDFQEGGKLVRFTTESGAGCLGH